MTAEIESVGRKTGVMGREVMRSRPLDPERSTAAIGSEDRDQGTQRGVHKELPIGSWRLTVGLKCESMAETLIGGVEKGRGETR